jgi:hypothetical protein
MRLLQKPARFRKARPRRTVIVGLLATAVLAFGGTVSATLPASASTAALSSTASPLQNKVLDAALASNPGGTRISASEDEFDGGRVIVGVTAPTAATSSTPVAPINLTGIPQERDEQGDTLVCTSGYFCAYGAQQFLGTCWMYVEAGSFSGLSIEFDWGAYSGAECGAVGTWSWINDSSDRVWKEQYFSGGTNEGYYFYQNGTPSGTTYCIDPYGGSNSYETDVTNSTDRVLGWIYMSGNTSAC